MDGTRLHDGGALEAGFEAGYLWDQRVHAQPRCPSLPSRQRERWMRGFAQGCEARATKAVIDRHKAATGQLKAARYDLLAAEWFGLLRVG